MKKSPLFIFVLIILFLSACIKAQSASNRSIVIENSCRPPCWHGIIPGQTTSQEAKQIIETESFTKPGSIIEEFRQLSPFSNQIYWDFNIGGGGMLLASEDGIVQAIWLDGLYDFTFEAAIECFGEPDFIYAFKVKTETIYLGIDTLFQGYIIGLSAIKPYNTTNSPNIQPETIIDSVIFVNPIIFNEFINEYFGSEILLEYDGQSLSQSHNWHGYGEYIYNQE